MTKKIDLDLYKKDFDRVAESIQQGKTPVFCEMRAERIIRSRIEGSYKDKPKVTIPEQEIKRK